MPDEKRDINIGFIINYRLDGWLGVTNYYLNLFNTIKSFSKKRNDKIKIIIITDNFITNKEKSYFKNLKIIKTKNLNRRSKLIKIFNLFQIIFFGKNFFFEKFLKKNNIDIISHTSFLGIRSKIPSIKWFPDFQEYHFPDNFGFKQKIARRLDLILSRIHSTKLLVSSQSVLRDLYKINKKAYMKTIVLNHFNKLRNEKIKKISIIEKKYNIKIPKNFIYLPNHYWKHKNHLTVFRSINFIKKKLNKKIYLVTTGEKNDYRFPDHKKKLENYLEKNGIKNQVFHLGVISKDEVYCLMKNCRFMINPSLSEGWGNAIDNAINFKKYILLSKIPVHLEQNPPNGIFFESKNYKKLAKIILNCLNKKNPTSKMLKDYKFNSLNFYLNYKKIIKSLL